jgi:flagellar basal body-associated protein FliL
VPQQQKNMQKINDQNSSNQQLNSDKNDENQQIDRPAKKSKTLLWILALFAIAGAGFIYYFWLNKKSPEINQDRDQLTATIIDNEREEENEETSEETVEKNEAEEFVFVFDEACSYEAKKIQPKSNYIGTAISYNVENYNCPSFSIVSKDFEVEGMNYWDTIVLDDSNEKTPRYILNSREHVIKLEENIYQLIGYGGYECSPDISSKLVYVFPENSSYKYINFHLGASYFSENDFVDICSPSDEAIKKGMDRVVNKENQEIERNLVMALDILKSMRLREE